MRYGRLALGTFNMQGRKQQFRLGVKGEHSSFVDNRLYYNLWFLVIPIDQCMDSFILSQDSPSRSVKREV
jgi:hypothetical protein